MRLSRITFLIVLAMVALPVVQPALSGARAASAANGVAIISVATDGTVGNGSSTVTAISSDGRFVLFNSNSLNLVAADGNASQDGFLRDTVQGITERVTLGTGAVEGNSDSYAIAMTTDARYIAFNSDATNLVAGDTNKKSDVFWRDRSTGDTQRVSVGLNRAATNGDSYAMGISQNGRHVLFISYATNLVVGDTNGARDAFIYDILDGAPTRVSVSSTNLQSDGETQLARFSPSGQYVAFESSGKNLVSGCEGSNSIYYEIFVRDLTTGITTCESVSTSGVPAGRGAQAPSISDDGRFVGFYSTDYAIVSGMSVADFGQQYVHDRVLGTTERVWASSIGERGNSQSLTGMISGNGRLFAFESLSNNLVPGATTFKGVYLRNLATGLTSFVPTTLGGGAPDGPSDSPVISADGRYIGFSSNSSDLVASAVPRGYAQVYVRDTVAAPTQVRWRTYIPDAPRSIRN